MSTATPHSLPVDVVDDEKRPPPRMTLAEFNALPDDPEVDRMLIRGELWEQPAQFRDCWSACILARISSHLRSWLNQQKARTGDIFGGEVGCDLPEFETGVGIDVAYFSQDVLDAQEPNASYIVGPPVLAVEILSPSDRQGEINGKVRVYLEAGVKLVWVIDPAFETVTIHRPDAEPVMLTGNAQLTTGPHLPGFAVRVSEIFGQ